MTRLRHSIVIERPMTEVYAMARQVERYPEFLPSYLESRILKQEGNRVLLQRKAMVGGKLNQWKSWATFQANETISFEHAEGPLKGMKVTWHFTSLSPKKTELVIIHVFEILKPFILGWWTEKFFYKPKISTIAGYVVTGFAKACEYNVRGMS